eukprot:Pompholyxophrys_punicea_v1_NODE_274_length_2425_cov_15.995782.p2 type:complete len:380 gc:universal NODE_274_length_2425_cov_15.995782:1283-144(-)
MAQLDKRSRLYHHGVFLDEITDDNGQYSEICNSYGVLGGDFHPDFNPTQDREAIYVYQDETTGKAGSVQKIMFSEKGRAMPARKNEGGSYMLSGFVVERGSTGRLAFSDDEYKAYKIRNPESKLPQCADMYLEIRKNKDGYWNSERFLEQMKTAISIFEELFPGAEAVILLDHSGGHTKKPEDGLNAHNMDVTSGRKQPFIRNTIWQGQVQHIGQRGLKSLVQERGLWKAGMKQDDLIEVLNQCEDFINQKSLVEELCETYGQWKHRVIWIPKFHAELNCSELKWAAIKSRSRQRSTGNMKTFKKVFKEEAESFTIQEVRRIARKSRNWMQAYRDLINLPNDSSFQEKILGTVKTYKSHRRVFDVNLKKLKDLTSTVSV